MRWDFAIQAVHCYLFFATQKLGPVTIHDPVCLVGLRPFMGPMGLLVTENYVVILASCEGQASWTVYSLRLPSAQTLYADMVSTALTHQYSVSGKFSSLYDLLD